MSKKKEQKKSKQQKPPSPTVKKVEVPKPEDQPAGQGPGEGVNLCDDCAYEFGECDGHPKFASEEDDRVVQCEAFVNVADMPAKDEMTGGQGRADEPVKAFNLALKKLDEFGLSILNSRAAEIREELDRRYGPDGKPTPEEAAATIVLIVQEIIEREGGPTDGLKHDDAAHAGDDQAQDEEDEGELTSEVEERLTVIKADAIQRAPLDRFEKDTTDYGSCLSCGTPLKRTTYSRYVDAIRCTKTGCPNYRNIVKTVPSGAK